MVRLYERPNSPYWQAEIEVCGTTKRVSTGVVCEPRKRREAEQAARRKAEELEQDAIREGGLTLKTAFEKFLVQKKFKPKSRTFYEGCAATLIASIGANTPITSIDERTLSRFIERRRDEGCGDTGIRNCLAVLSSLLSTSKAWEKGVKTNVVRNFDKRGILSPNKVRMRYLRESEYTKIMKACDDPELRLFILLAVQTGMRKDELLRLRWNEVDLENGEIILFEERNKNSRTREVPLTEEALELLKNTQSRTHAEWVFYNRSTRTHRKDMYDAWNRLRTKLGLKDVVIHGFRHTFASWSLQHGIAEKAVMDLMGHTTNSMTKRYSKSSKESLREAISQFSQITKRTQSPHTA